jgi:hypothetical protein
MNWKEYEKETHEYFETKYPNATIKYNVKLDGRKSKTKRQVDILIEEIVCGYMIRMAIECKNWSQPLDVADVGSFIYTLEDIGVDRGIMVSRSGYSEAAKNLSYEHTNLNLHVLKFDELELFHGFYGVPYRGRFGAIVTPPNGWILQSKVPKEMKTSFICSMYPMEHNFDSALDTPSIIFFDIPEFPSEKEHNTCKLIDTFIQRLEKSTYSFDEKAEVEYFDEQFNGKQIKLRITKYYIFDYVETAIITCVGNFLIHIFGAHKARDQEDFITHAKYILNSIIPIELPVVVLPTNSDREWAKYMASQPGTTQFVSHSSDKDGNSVVKIYQKLPSEDSEK